MENNNKKIVFPTLVAILTLVMLTVGATYAYFVVTSNNNFGTKTITATTPSIGSVALTSGNNITMSLTASQMMEGSSDITYYASEEGTTTTETTLNIGTATVTGEGTYSCDYTLTIDDNSSSLYDAFQNMAAKSTGQIILTVNGVEYDFNTTNLFPKIISGTMSGLTSNAPQNITAQLKLVNKKSIDQSSLADKTLTLTFTVSDFKCTAIEESSNQGVGYVLSTASSEDIWESTLEEDGIRFVGTDPSNYVCFGTTDKDTCTGNTDLYMYRIIGIFKDENNVEHLKLIKKTSLGATLAWDESGSDVEWFNSSLYGGLNGAQFLNNVSYSYMQDSNWLGKIADWNYVSVNTKGGISYSDVTSQNVYLHEMNKSSKISTVGEWNIQSAKIGLMYVSDYMLALGNNALNYISSNDAETFKTNWMHITNNDSSSSIKCEWTMIRAINDLGSSRAYAIDGVGNVMTDDVAMPIIYTARPVFYLTSDIAISGEGTSTNPFIVN